MLPGNVGRNVLGGFASQESVDAFNKEQGLDRPAVTQYLDWASHAVRGDFGKSYTSNESVNSILARALPKSAELALLAFVLMIPLSFLGGLISALKAYGPADRVISIAGLSLTVVPEFVSALVAIVIFGIVLGWLPVSARWPDGADIFVQINTSCCPRSCSSACSSATSPAWCEPARSRRSTPTTPARRISRAWVAAGAVQARAAQRAAAHDRGRRHADRLPARRPRDRRAGVQLPRAWARRSSTTRCSRTSPSCRRAPW